MGKVALITVVHDPSGKKIELFKQLQNDLESIYAELFIAISDQSSAELIEVMEGSRFNVKVIPKKGAAEARREAVKFGLTGVCGHFHYCDFDRLLTWGKKHLDELKQIVQRIPDYGYLILGRTERAMETHPVEWKETERITNKIVSLELGQEVDITAGSCAFSRKNAEYIKKYSNGKMTDAEWVMIARRIAKSDIGYLPVEGLEYHEDTNGISRKISEAEKWLGRLELSYVISETAVRTGK
ncbi:hypothetical protein [Neobacillus sp. YIM B06451]|uniref:hypothetical protein n=1 Tax=Neobacillus sp. YIM B06451 TaxID=3070994 RepID=UPI00292E9527|nr:hypothetical protein [Neobacillus sp. YIM B06451]